MSACDGCRPSDQRHGHGHPSPPASVRNAPVTPDVERIWALRVPVPRNLR